MDHELAKQLKDAGFPQGDVERAWYNTPMKIEITPQMLEEARKKRQEAEQLAQLAPDEGFDNICVGCE